jgi:hypothetical protein
MSSTVYLKVDKLVIWLEKKLQTALVLPRSKDFIGGIKKYIG